MGGHILYGDAAWVKIGVCADIRIDGIRIYWCNTSETRNVGYDSAFLVLMKEGGGGVRPHLAVDDIVSPLLARREDTIKRNKGMRISRNYPCGTGCRSAITATD